MKKPTPPVVSDKHARRIEQRDVECPTCDAKSGDLCTGIGGQERRSNHKARILKHYVLHEGRPQKEKRQ